MSGDKEKLEFIDAIVNTVNSANLKTGEQFEYFYARTINREDNYLSLAISKPSDSVETGNQHLPVASSPAVVTNNPRTPMRILDYANVSIPPSEDSFARKIMTVQFQIRETMLEEVGVNKFAAQLRKLDTPEERQTYMEETIIPAVNGMDIPEAAKAVAIESLKHSSFNTLEFYKENPDGTGEMSGPNAVDTNTRFTLSDAARAGAAQQLLEEMEKVQNAPAKEKEAALKKFEEFLDKWDTPAEGAVIPKRVLEEATETVLTADGSGAVIPGAKLRSSEEGITV
ncbi:MAG: hypothetical protein H6908_03255 [Hyphomicrobiales bacterium]|nr:hypothetical protein [Hyphomicrobiales bacterium]